MAAHGQDPSTREGEEERQVFKASLSYKVSNRTALDTLHPDLKQNHTVRNLPVALLGEVLP